jgi:hypothetical protein
MVTIEGQRLVRKSNILSCRNKVMVSYAYGFRAFKENNFETVDLTKGMRKSSLFFLGSRGKQKNVLTA